MSKKISVLVAATANIPDLLKGNFPQSNALHSIVAEANGRATNFTYRARDVARIAAVAEKRLIDAKLPSSQRPGLVVEARSAGPYAKAYKNSAIGTSFKLKRTKKGWILFEYERSTVYPATPERISFFAPATMIETIKQRATLDLHQLPAN